MTQLARLQRWVGQRVPAFVEQRNERGALQARTFHNVAISFAGDEADIGRVVELEVQNATSFGLFGAR